MAACSRPGDGAGGAEVHSRYVGVGLYPAGRMWAQVAGPGAAKDRDIAKLADDEQVIVTVDGRTGEVRQCGNLSGHCIGLNPWTGPAQAAPVSLAKHADALDREQVAPAAAQPPGPPR